MEIKISTPSTRLGKLLVVELIFVALSMIMMLLEPIHPGLGTEDFANMWVGIVCLLCLAGTCINTIFLCGEWAGWGD